MESGRGTARPLQSQQTGPEEEEDRQGWQDGDSVDPGTSRQERGHKKSKGQDLPPARCAKETCTPELPYDVLVRVFQYLDLESKQKAAQVCRAWKNAAYRPLLWKQVEPELDLGHLCPSAFPSLQERDLQKVVLTSVGNQEVFRSFLSFVPSLRSLRIPSEETTGSSLGRALSCPLPHLETLVVAELTEIGASLGGILPQHLKSLRSLTLRTSTPRDVAVTSEDFPHLPDLQHLSLEGLRLNDDSVRTVCQRCPNVETVYICLSSAATLQSCLFFRKLPRAKEVTVDVQQAPTVPGRLPLPAPGARPH